VLKPLALALALCAPAAAEEAPARVVSMNLCTDQLAMALAAPGQLLAVSWLARDPRSSLMAAEAQRWPVLRGLAEEIYLLHPDLVLADSYSGRATVEMLRRLGVRVATIEQARSLDDVRAALLEMGRLLHREAAAEAMAAAFDDRLAALRQEGGPRPLAATYAANGYMAGDESLPGDTVRAAGYEDLSGRLGLASGGMLPLELLLMAEPDLLITGARYPGRSRAEDILLHPALAALPSRKVEIDDRDWLCGLPAVLDTVERLARLREAG
jgi:iron complex transport system substrate-binding protein